ncbi:DUF3253 domain-containing protein [Thermoleptolyngbya oregonensis NK1-22]|uniref:DUF3253 domain-containing protein n=1 Tax=Thermoleptolyngbya oregonensis NK1-22 TaxID=2547457 RepID=A0AA97BCS4_9CYAN|nr:DUF3253 domain-containing protein [Thermoleptolyngbya oregonensis]WOB43374.1 DUF3253 domain-containing protein [Thermoleptolyngbya oregonensis NK1-22]
MNSDTIRECILKCILKQVQQRGPDKSICPSEVARSLGGETWRSLMPLVREVGADLAKSGAIVVTQKGIPVDPQTAKGPIRFKQATDRGNRDVS